MTIETTTNKSYSALPAGVLLNESYQIMSVLGAGGFGVTYLAWDSIRERHVVIKECLPGDYAVRDDQTYEVHPLSGETAGLYADCLINARHEAETLARVSNPGVVKVYDLFDQYGTFYYVMEYIQGRTLHDIMVKLKEEGRQMPADQVESLLVFTLEILESLHQQKIYHCDIKPGNIFISPEGKPKLIDFGAVRSKELQHQGLIQVTPGYTPPEFYPGNLRELGPWSDVYELGATFYELLTGNVPEASDQRFKVDRMVKISSIPELRKSYPLVLLSSIDKALTPDHKGRFASARDWIDYLDSYGGGRQIKTVNPRSHAGARMKAAGMPTVRKKKANYTPLLMLGVLIVILAGLALGIRNGSISIDSYPELAFIKRMLGMPDQPGQSGQQQGQEATPARGEETTRTIAPVDGVRDAGPVIEIVEPVKSGNTSDSNAPPADVEYEEEIIEAEE